MSGKTNQKWTDGEWQPVIQRYDTEPTEMVVGIGVRVETEGDGIAYRAICDMMLPDSDEEYAKAHENIKADAQLMSASKNLLEACTKLLKESGSSSSEGVTMAIRAISKALNVPVESVREAFVNKPKPAPSPTKEEVEESQEETDEADVAVNPEKEETSKEEPKSEEKKPHPAKAGRKKKGSSGKGK
jgi:hypothetical protein